MRKRTPQEIADFFGYYVAQDKNGAWYGFDDKPELDENTWRVNNDGYTFISETMIDFPFNHDWKHLYEPCVRNTCENEDENARITQEPSTNPVSLCPHQSEVHIGDRYVLLGEIHPSELMQKVEEYLNDGFKLYGNPFVGPDSSYGYIHYQVMVRGV